MDAQQLILAREARRLGNDRELSRRFARGELTRLMPGVYLPMTIWQSLDSASRHRALAAAAVAVDPTAQISHESAAAMWRLPVFGDWPSKVHSLVASAAGGRSTSSVVRHARGRDETCVRIDGVEVTSLARTALDVSTGRDFARSVVFLDAVLSGRHHPLGGPVYKPQLLHALEGAAPSTAPARSRRAIQFAHHRALSPGESVSRTELHVLGAPAPELQVEFRDRRGFIGDVDFWWPEFGIVGEFDGKSKYGKRRLYQKNLSVEEIVWREKRREDRLRRVVKNVIRWDWELLMNRREFAMLLIDGGLPLNARPFQTH